MNFRLHGITQAFPSTRPHPDPWGTGVTFFVKGEDDDAFQAHERRKIFRSPVGAAITTIELKAQLASAASGFSLTPEEQRQMSQRLVESADFSAVDFDALVDSDGDVDGILLLLDGWEGEATPYSGAAARELLTDKTWLPAGMPFSGVTPLDADSGVKGGGRPLGEALRNFIRWAAHQNVVQRRQALDAAKGNSEASSGQAPAGTDA